MSERTRKSVAGKKAKGASSAGKANKGAPKAAAKGKPVEGGGDWREATLERMRGLIMEAVPEMVEERKWKKPSNMAGVAVWSHPQAGMICTGEKYAKVAKLTFARGASVPDPSGLFNAGLGRGAGGTRRAIDIREGETVDAKAFKALVKAAVAEKTRDDLPGKKGKPSDGKVRLLSGGNPQIAKGDGDAPVQKYIAAMPGWKSDIGRRLDALIVRTVPGVRKAVRWNSPFYGSKDGGWFASVHVLTKYVKVTFFDGKSLKPLPPGGTAKSGEARWIDIYEEDGLDEAQMAGWVKQAAGLPGWVF